MIATLLAIMICSQGDLNAQDRALSFDQLQSELEHVLELITKRQLSDEEIERAANEFAAHFDGRCDRRCVDAVELNKRLAEPMAARAGSPRDLLSRQWFSHELYFSPTQAGSFIQSLANEVDPIRLADAKSSRIMTEGDIVGLMNINHFLRHGGKPTAISITTDGIEEHVAVFHQRYVQGSESLPYRATLAAELWAGLDQNWERLAEDQKDAVVGYLSDKAFKASLDISTYQALLNLSEDEAMAFQRDNQAAQRSARLEWMTEKSLRVTEAASNVRASGSYCYFCR